MLSANAIENHAPSVVMTVGQQLEHGLCYYYRRQAPPVVTRE